MKQDLRFEKTEKAIQKAFFELLQQKDMAKISVKEICELAQISRNAFYQHYETKEHLYDSLLQHILISIEKACRPLVKDMTSITDVERRLFLDNILFAVHQNRFIIYQLLSNQPAVFSAAFKEMLISAMCLSTIQLNGLPNLYYIHVFAGGIVAFVNYWLLETSDTLEEAQDQLFLLLGQLNLPNR
ncbi:TetR/AcrR family transcriptional regulator [Carnobacteriaceae bacterium zg-84]|uniref:TetR/AcrR family transcriptional regulator n=1 Tax=Granulicatella sp. zg-84 TaxID=2678503 RepID=UPI0013BF827B|nr:TetR/AcrR family transcriptional regulator [Granulicatella sp. zg-84]NEW65824.1 TetR family transcriptional regulator [Granulicatella sp. zg-84]QMI86328.1 TetR/AcrR family transcriptional regulator [Carnobacteriaceae bacterium zg-84]